MLNIKHEDRIREGIRGMENRDVKDIKITSTVREVIKLNIKTRQSRRYAENAHDTEVFLVLWSSGSFFPRKNVFRYALREWGFEIQVTIDFCVVKGRNTYTIAHIRPI